MSQPTNAALIALLVVTLWGGASFAADPSPGGMQLLPGYVHTRLQGFDSVPGRIEKKGGLTIQYDIGAIPKLGAPSFGGQFTDHPKSVAAKERQWYKEHQVGGQEVHLAYTKKNALLVSFPESGINFSVEVKNTEEMTDALLMILSYRGVAKKR